MLLSKFIEAELNAYIENQRLTESPLVVKLIVKAFEAYDEYKRLTKQPEPLDEEIIICDNGNIITHNQKGGNTVLVADTPFRMVPRIEPIWGIDNGKRTPDEEYSRNPEPGPLD